MTEGEKNAPPLCVHKLTNTSSATKTKVIYLCRNDLSLKAEPEKVEQKGANMCLSPEGRRAVAEKDVDDCLIVRRWTQIAS